MRRGLELFGYVGDAVGVVARVADGQRRVGDALPAAEQRSVGRRMAGPLHKGAARNGERGFFVQEVGPKR